MLSVEQLLDLVCYFAPKHPGTQNLRFDETEVPEGFTQFARQFYANWQEAVFVVAKYAVANGLSKDQAQRVTSAILGLAFEQYTASSDAQQNVLGV